MFRVGLVKQQDLQGARLRVAFPDRDQMLSYWLPILFSKTQNDKSYWIPDIGEQVVCLMDEHDEAGTVLGAIYSSATPRRSRALTNTTSHSRTERASSTTAQRTRSP
jgi:phage baseplate assembly protein V